MQPAQTPHFEAPHYGIIHTRPVCLSSLSLTSKASKVPHLRPGQLSPIHTSNSEESRDCSHIHIISPYNPPISETTHYPWVRGGAE